MGEAARALGAIGDALMLVGVALLPYLVFQLVCTWVIFTKIGKPGWKGIIPFCSNYVLAKTVWDSQVALVQLVLSVVGFILIRVPVARGGAIAASLVATVLGLISQYRLVRYLRKPSWCFVLAILCPPVYYGLMAFASEVDTAGKSPSEDTIDL